MGIEEFLLDEAEKKGIAQGIEKGIYENKLAIAIEMKREGIPAARIARVTLLSTEEIERL